MNKSSVVRPLFLLSLDRRPKTKGKKHRSARVVNAQAGEKSGKSRKGWETRVDAKRPGKSQERGRQGENRAGNSAQKSVDQTQMHDKRLC